MAREQSMTLVIMQLIEAVKVAIRLVKEADNPVNNKEQYISCLVQID